MGLVVVDFISFIDYYHFRYIIIGTLEVYLKFSGCKLIYLKEYGNLCEFRHIW